MAVKRHTIWLEDVEWELLTDLAKRAGLNPSAYVRKTAIDQADAPAIAHATQAVRAWPKPSQRGSK